MNYKTIRYILSWVLRIEALCMLLSLLCAFIYKEHNVWVWLLCITLCFGVSALLSLKTKGQRNMFAKDGFVTVALSWIVISIFGAIPFVLSGAIPNYIHALFETVSGFTTTGASILTDVEAMPRSMLFWRSFTHWIGGMGVLVFLLAIIPLTGNTNFFLVKAESPGPAVSKLVPKVKSTAKMLYSIYVVLTFIQIILLLAGGMDAFDSITLSFGTAGTGGFATKNTGLADYSTYSQNVITVFMIIFGVDFAFYYVIVMRKFRALFKFDEVKGYLGVILLAIVAISFNCRSMFDTMGETVKHAAFQVASIITTTGYSTVDFDKWPEFSKTILVGLMFVGA